MIIPWRKYIFTINDIYGDKPRPNQIPSADVQCYFQQPNFIDSGKRNALYKRVKTLCIDLNMGEESLRKDMHRTTRYEINKAGREQLVVEHIKKPTNKEVAAFTTFFNPFAKEKKIEQCREDKVRALQKSNQLVISSVYHPNGCKLASHLIIANGDRAIGLYSCSVRFSESQITPAEIGRANRYLHWQDILFFKRENYDIYDFQGLFSDENNQAHRNINKFKKGFGGSEKISYNSYIPQTRKGTLMLLLLWWKWRKQVELVKDHAVLKNSHN